jgi:hypothetical protein
MEVHQNGFFCIVINNLEKEEEFPVLRVSVQGILRKFLDSYQILTIHTFAGL